MIPGGIVLQGLVVGSLAAIDAIALVLVFRATRVVNLAQSAIGYVAGVCVGLLVTSAGWSFWWALPVGLCAGAGIGALTDRVILRRLAEAPRAIVIVASIGIAQLLTALAVALPFALTGRTLPTYTIGLGVELDVFPTRLLGPHILALAALPVAWAAAHLFLRHTRTGLAAVAHGQDAERARALGVPGMQVRTAVWAVAGALGALSGTLQIPVSGFNLGGGIGPVAVLLALAPAVVAGFRRIHVAALAALALGVLFRAASWYTNTASAHEAVVGIAIVLAVVFARQTFARDHGTSRSTAWDAATTPRPLRASERRLGGVRALVAVVFACTVAGISVVGASLSPSGEVRLVQVSAFAIAALGVATAWIFAGEISLGHWGLAGFGAVIAASTPAPWPVRCAVATVAMGAAGAAAGAGARRRAPLAFAAVTLAAAATAPLAVLRVVGKTADADPRTVGIAASVLALACAAAVVALRRSTAGARIVAARDDPARAPWLGASVVTSRVTALALSGALAGLAGSLYFAGSPSGLITGLDGSFDATLSLELLAMAVIGGLGSPVGAVVGAVATRTAQILLPGAWGDFVSGTGIVLVLLFAPGGFGRVLEAVRARTVASIVDERRAVEAAT